jgi:hypothetical protein
MGPFGSQIYPAPPMRLMREFEVSSVYSFNGFVSPVLSEGVR